MPLQPLEGTQPTVDTSCFVAPTAYVIGAVNIGPESSVWYGAVVRGDSEAIRIGCRVNIQDNCVVHADAGDPTEIGDDVTIGHGAVVHGATIGRGSLIGINSVILDGAVIGEESIVGAGAVVSRQVVPPRSLVLGVPGRVVRQLRDEEVAHILAGNKEYVTMAAKHRAELAAQQDGSNS